MTNSDHNIAVLTGDIIGSTSLNRSELGFAIKTLEEASTYLQGCLDTKDTHFTRHRGDGWQIILDTPKYALRAALTLKAAIKSCGKQFDTYIGIAIGPRPNEIPKNLNQINDPAFVASGRLLESLQKQRVFAPTLGYDKAGAIAASVVLADHIAQGWTPAQAEAILPMLDPKNEHTYTDIAQSLNKSRQAYTKALIASGYEHIGLALTLLEAEND